MSTVTRIVHLSADSVDTLLDALDVILDAGTNENPEIKNLYDTVNNLSVDSILIKFGQPD